MNWERESYVTAFSSALADGQLVRWPKVTREGNARINYFKKPHTVLVTVGYQAKGIHGETAVALGKTNLGEVKSHL